MVTGLPFLGLYLFVQQIISLADILEHFIVYLPLQLFDEVERFNCSHFIAAELRSRELNDLHKVGQEVCGRARLCPGALLHDMMKTQLQRWDILVHKATAAILGRGFTSSVSALGQCNLYWVSIKFIILEKKEKHPKKK